MKLGPITARAAREWSAETAALYLKWEALRDASRAFSNQVDATYQAFRDSENRDYRASLDRASDG
jgi:hypothetical protein